MPESIHKQPPQGKSLEELNSFLSHCRNSEFYRQRIKDKPLLSFDDFKLLPMTTKDDLRDNSPWGFLCVPRKDLFQYHESFGTTGVPASTWLTEADFLDLSESMNGCCDVFNDEDIVLVRFPYAISSVAHSIHRAAQMQKACVIPVSSRNSVSPFKRTVGLLKKLDATVLAALPLQAVLIAETAEIMGLNPKKDFPELRMLYTAGEALTPQKRRLLTELWGVPVRDNYGTTETGAMAVDCRYGSLHPLEDRFLFEVLDDDLKNDSKPGETGNLVVTTLKRKATPLLRYVTGDRVKLTTKPCPCGKDRIIEIHGRMQDRIVVNGTVLDLLDIQEIVSYLPFQRFWVAGESDGALKLVIEADTDGMVSANQGRFAEPLSIRIEPSTLKQLEDRYKIRIQAEIVPKGLLCDRSVLVDSGSAGKPKYIYTPLEMQEKSYLHGIRT